MEKSVKSIVFVSVPVVSVEVPPLGPALMQSVAIQQGFSSSFIDLNLDLYYLKLSIAELDSVWNWQFSKIKFSAAKAYINLFRQCLQKIQKINPEYVGISVFSYQSHPHAELFFRWLKRRHVGFKIIVGGAGAAARVDGNFEKDYFGKSMLERGLIDYYVAGEGELALAAILNNQLPYPGVNNQDYEILQSFDSVPIPSFDTFELDKYQYPLNRTSISVEGSRGCVRNCSFCDIKSIWKKYKFKSGEKLAKELIVLGNKYQTSNFWFNDSLVNGSLSAHRDFIKYLANHNQTNDPKITWSGQYIIRPRNNTLDQDIQLAKQSGCHTLAIGIESGSHDVRRHMGKDFSNDDIDYTFQLLRKNDIKIFLLMIVGYPTETEKDFECTLNLLRRYKNLALEGTISGVNLGYTLSILPNTPLSAQKDKLQIQGSEDNIFWFNETSTIQTRISRRIRAQELGIELGYNFFDADNQFKAFENLLDGKHTSLTPAQNHG